MADSANRPGEKGMQVRTHGMMNIRSGLILPYILLLAACTPIIRPVKQAITTSIPIAPVPPTSTPSATAIKNISATATTDTLVYADPFDGIVATLEASDPQSPDYDPNSSAYAAFPQVLKQLAGTGINGASMLAYALTFPRPDSYLAAQVLITLGPAIIGTDLGQLTDSLLDRRAQVRLYAVLTIGTVGNEASCAIGNIAPRLWDPDPYVRSASAEALSSITGKDLVQAGHEFTPQPFSTGPVPPDMPEGSLTGVARKWWDEQGSKINWHPGYGMCGP